MCEGVIDNNNDVDYYKIVIDQPGVISMEFAQDQYDDSNTWEYSLIQDAVENPLWKGSSRGNSTAYAESPQFGAAPGTYYIKVSGYHLVGINYRVKLNYEPSTEWETEKNDDATSADEIVPGNIINGNIYTNFYYSESIPTECYAGTYYVWYKVFGNDDYEDSDEGGKRDWVEAFHVV